MSDKEMAKDWLNEMSGYEINIIKYFENLVLTKKDLFYKNRELQQENQQLKEVIEKVISIAYKYGQIDGSHHKLWVIDQILRLLLGEKYYDFIKDYEENGEYTWDTGIAP